jgi:hypothetical protein
VSVLARGIEACMRALVFVRAGVLYVGSMVLGIALPSAGAFLMQL